MAKEHVYKLLKAEVDKSVKAAKRKADGDADNGNGEDENAADPKGKDGKAKPKRKSKAKKTKTDWLWYGFWKILARGLFAPPWSEMSRCVQ